MTWKDPGKSWWEHKVAIVTGAGQGLGRGIAEHLASIGAHVVVAEIAEASGAETVEQIRAAGGTATGSVCDISDPRAVDALIEQVVAEHGRIDVLVNNAGIVRADMLWNLSDDDWDLVIRTNLSSQFFTTRAVVQSWMKEHGGSIVNISSIGGLRGSIGQINYATAKAGVIGLTKAAALELGKFGVRVNAVAPGTTRTPMTQKLMDDDKLRERFQKEIPLGRFGEPRDVARAVAYLGSDEASWVTGKVLVVDGGAYN